MAKGWKKGRDSKNINTSLELFQPKKTRPYITERLLMGRKESNQTNKHYNYIMIRIKASCKPRILSLFLNWFINSIKQEHSCKILYLQNLGQDSSYW